MSVFVYVIMEKMTPDPSLSDFLRSTILLKNVKKKSWITNATAVFKYLQDFFPKLSEVKINADVYNNYN